MQLKHKPLGATRRQILVLFLAEALLLSTLGAALGLLVGQSGDSFRVSAAASLCTGLVGVLVYRGRGLAGLTMGLGIASLLRLALP
ncbi:MAG: hypothetical protein U9P00_07405, partial [Pseudomonadota bacterium]|nr:hypothetical protein [Pseudomonadota bacterium]